MKRRWNFSIWVGFLVVLAGALSYVPLFVQFPITRDFPWANLLLFLTGGILLGIGLRRAFRQPELYRGRILGSILAALSVAVITLFVWGTLYHTRRLPLSAAAPRVGQKAPDFTLPDQNGQPVTLASLLSPSSVSERGAKPSGVLLIFYRGHW
jgi:hypothetical protein